MNKLRMGLISVILACLLWACQPSTKTPQANTNTDELKDTSFVDVDVRVSIKEDTIISDRFLELIKHIDTLGYVFDTSRYALDKQFMVDQYVVFEQAVDHTIPFLAESFKEDTLTGYDELVEDFNIKPFKKAQKVMVYYFKKKQPKIIRGQTWYTDGLIEEWMFETGDDATEAANELIKSRLAFIYFNTGAYVCAIDDCMYVFYSRAAGFMCIQKQFFQWFIQQNDPTVYGKDIFC